MKRTLLVLVAIFMVLALFACKTPTVGPEVLGDAAPAAIAEAPVKITEAPVQDVKNEAYEITYQGARSYVSSIGTVWLQGIAEITNTGNVPLYLSSGGMDFEDGSGKLLATETMVSTYPDVIQPGEKGYMYCENTFDGENPEAVNIIPRPSVEKAKVECIRLPVSEMELSDGQYGGVKIMGRVENTMQTEANMVYVVAVLLNAEGTPVGVLMNILMDAIQPGDKIGVELNSFALPDDITAETIVDFTVFAYPMQMQF